MAQETKEKEIRGPDYRGHVVAVWSNLDKNGKRYMAVKLFNQITVSCFAPKDEPR